LTQDKYRYGTELELRKLFNIIKEKGYRVIGPKVIENVIRLAELKDYSELPFNIEDVQGPGTYKLVKGNFFRHGPDSPKKFLFPPRLLLFKVYDDWTIEIPEVEEELIAFFGIKPCDLAAIKAMDKVQGELGDPYYNAVRKNLLIVVENCVEPGETCFCSTMETGPIAESGFDIAYTRIGDVIVFDYDSELGAELLRELDLKPLDPDIRSKYAEVVEKASSKARADFSIEGLPEELELSLKSPIYKEVTEKCLGCANCNMVCPTCFCFDVVDVPVLDGSAERIRVWDGCFSYSYAIVAGGHFRPDLWARYRHWLLHKFSYWLKQFGRFGCVGCGRCITWCPVGIDVRESIIKIINWVRSHGETSK